MLGFINILSWHRAYIKKIIKSDLISEEFIKLLRVAQTLSSYAYRKRKYDSKRRNKGTNKRFRLQNWH